VDLLADLIQFCEQLERAKPQFLIAYSGGLDSEVLLALFAQLQQQMGVAVRAIHINHQLSPHASTWAEHCRNSCAHYGLGFQTCTVDLMLKAGDSLEQEARRARYRVFAEELLPDEYLVTAHHQDDQAETLLLQLLRGSGLKGLSAMPKVKVFGRGFHLRPLLDVGREQIANYAADHHLHWVEDESNADSTLMRNFIRHQWLAPFKQHFPNVAVNLARAAKHCAQAQQLLEEFAHQLLPELAGSKPQTLSVNKLLTLELEKRHLVIRTWLSQLSLPMPNQKKLNEISNSLLLASVDKNPQVEWQGVSIRRYRDDLYALMQRTFKNPLPSYVWDLTQNLYIPEVGILRALPVTGHGISKSKLKQVRVKFQQTGAQICLPKRGHRRLKNLFQEWGVPPWQRSQIPLLYAGDKLVAVMGYAIDKDYQAESGEPGITFIIESAQLTDQR
jgi:tRNA(Ile)-lysidine synthase